MPKTKPDIKGLYFFIASDSLVLKQEVNRLLEQFQEGGTPPLLDILDGTQTTMEEILILAQTPALFAQKRILWIKNYRGLEKVVGKDDVKSLKEMAEGLSSDTRVVFTGLNADGRLKFVSELKKISQFVEQDTTESWFRTQKDRILAKYHQKMEEEAFGVLYEFWKNSPSGFTAELEKISIYHGEKKNAISLRDVSAVACLTKEDPFYKFAEELLNKNHSGALRVLNNILAQEDSMIGVLSYLLNCIRFLMQARALIDSGYIKSSKIPAQYRSTTMQDIIQSFPAQLLENAPREYQLLRQHPYRIFIFLRQSLNFSSRQLSDLFLKTCSAYWESVNSRPADKTLEKLVLSL